MEDYMQKYSGAQREGFIQDWKTSGKTISDFCSEQGISKNTFQYWLKRERQKTPTAGFIEISGVPCQSISMQEMCIEIGKLKITLSGEKNVGDIEALIKILWVLEC